MKKFLAAILMFGLTLSFVACTPVDDIDEDSNALLAVDNVEKNIDSYNALLIETREELKDAVSFQRELRHIDSKFNFEENWILLYYLDSYESDYICLTESTTESDKVYITFTLDCKEGDHSENTYKLFAVAVPAGVVYNKLVLTIYGGHFEPEKVFVNEHDVSFYREWSERKHRILDLIDSSISLLPVDNTGYAIWDFFDGRSAFMVQTKAEWRELEQADARLNPFAKGFDFNKNSIVFYEGGTFGNELVCLTGFRVEEEMLILEFGMNAPGVATDIGGGYMVACSIPKSYEVTRCMGEMKFVMEKGVVIPNSDYTFGDTKIATISK